MEFQIGDNDIIQKRTLLGIIKLTSAGYFTNGVCTKSKESQNRFKAGSQKEKNGLEYVSRR